MRTLPWLAISAVMLGPVPAWAVDQGKAPVQGAKLVWPESPPQVRLVSTVGADAAGPLRLLRPFSAVVDRSGRILVADTGHRGVIVHDQQGAATKWTGNARFPLYGPVAMALHPDGRLFVADAYQAKVVVFNSGGAPVALFGNDVLERPSAIAIDAQRGRIHVGDSRLHQIVCFDLQNFSVLRTIGGPAEKGRAEPGRFSSPAGLAVNSKGQLHVTDVWNCRVQVFGPEGEFLQSFATQCPQASGYGRPSSIAIDNDDRVLVAGQEDGDVQVFDGSGKPLHVIAGARARPPASAARTALAVDTGRIYIIEQSEDNGRVQVFSQTRARRSR